jgi:GNAT superfamily N-acetyltransferase
MPNRTVDDHVIRKIWPLDVAAFASHLKRLDHETRIWRFGMVVSDAFLDGYAATAHGPGTVVFGAFSGGAMHASAELRTTPYAGKRAAEAAFTVEPTYQDHGLGSALMERIISTARNRMIGELNMVCLKANSRMQHIAQKFGGQLTVEPDVVSGTILPAQPTPFSLFGEQLHDAQEMAAAVLSWARLPLSPLQGTQ